MRIGLSLETTKLADGREVINCRCGHSICESTENYKTHVLMHEGTQDEAGPKKIFSGEYKGEERFVFRQFYCPKCLTLLECEVIPRGSPPIQDFRISPSRLDE